MKLNSGIFTGIFWLFLKDRSGDILIKNVQYSHSDVTSPEKKNKRNLFGCLHRLSSWLCLHTPYPCYAGCIRDWRKEPEKGLDASLIFFDINSMFMIVLCIFGGRRNDFILGRPKFFGLDHLA